MTPGAEQAGDGGFSCGNMGRPGLKVLLANIDAGLVDVMVIYKIDRLARSLSDFTKIVEQLDAKEASFVSVTRMLKIARSTNWTEQKALLGIAAA